MLNVSFSRVANEFFDRESISSFILAPFCCLTSADFQKTWSARAGGRKPPSVESVTEPLDMHSLQKTSSPSLSCNLQEKLLQVFAAASEEVDATTSRTDNDDSQSGASVCLSL